MVVLQRPNLHRQQQEQRFTSLLAYTTNGIPTSRSTLTNDINYSYEAQHYQQPVEVEAAGMGEELEVTPVPRELEHGGQPTIGELVSVNFGTDDNPRPIFVSDTLIEEEREDYRNFLMEYRDCFAWSYKEMPGLDPRVATYKLVIDP